MLYDDYKKFINCMIIKEKSNIIILNIKKSKTYFFWYLKYYSILRAKQLLDLFIVDYPTYMKRFEVNYVLLSIHNNYRIWCKMWVKEHEMGSTIINIYEGACWLEREAWDMYGIFFLGNIDIRRILSDYGFYGHALRKDFPLTGYIEIRYDDIMKIVVTEFLEMAQELRIFDFNMPWKKQIVI